MLLRVKNLSHCYKKNPVLRDVSFEIYEGELLGLVGESGCGKSTLARLIGGFEKPASGKVLFDQKDIHRLKSAELKRFRRDCQTVFQDSLSSLDPSMRVLAALKEPLNHNFRLREGEKEERIRRLMKQVDLNQEILSRFPASISGGERQRVNLCRALMVSPRLMICDEITSSLDVITQSKLLRLLERCGEELGMTILFISHDIHAVTSLCDRVLVMERGRIVETLTKDDGFRCSHPYTKALFQALPVIHPSLRGEGYGDTPGRMRADGWPPCRGGCLAPGCP